MQIKEIKINGFGKIKDKTIELKNGINLIKGKNETGKSTLADFIRVIFYGISKNKNGKAFSDFDKYLPWGNTEFVGQIKYNLNGEDYTLRRDFSKNKANMYDGFGNDITDDFSKTKKKGSNIGFDQLNIDEDTFVSSCLVRQNDIMVDAMSQNAIIQKLGNAIETGDESLSYDEISKKLEKRLHDEVGTDRTTTKPKYIYKKAIEDLELKASKLTYKRKRSAEIKNEKELLDIQIDELNKEYEKLKQIKEIDDKYEKEIQNEKAKFDYEQKMKKEEQAKREKVMFVNKIINTVMILGATIALAIYSWLKELYIVSIISLILGVVALVIDRKFSYKEVIEADTNNFDLVLEDIKKKKKKELGAFENDSLVASVTDMRTPELKKLIDEKETTIKGKELDVHKLVLEENSLKENLDLLNETIEELEYNKNEYQKILKKEAYMNLGIEKLKESYEEVKRAIIPKLEEDMQYTISKTTDGKYSNIKYSDIQGVVAQNEFGELVTLDKLSCGAIDQIYLGFRMAVADKFESLPIIFDEAFVYFDDDRLENILKTISEMSLDKQIVILSCSDREEKMLRNISADFNKIEL